MKKKNDKYYKKIYYRLINNEKFKKMNLFKIKIKFFNI